MDTDIRTTGSNEEGSTDTDKSVETNRRPAAPFRLHRTIGRWIRCQHPVSAAVGELGRSAEAAVGLRQLEIELWQPAGMLRP
ncbi:MAG: hypothetical protein FJ387_29425 [Verrucomicrobia bacterium]|nr:hypothetical protein [Verrucomicrobiota bacterium]